MNTENTEDTESTEKNLSEIIIGAAIEVHKQLGPGLLESAYTSCLAYELKRRGLNVEQEKPLPVVYKDLRLEFGYRLDLLVNESIIVEIKAIDTLLAIHEAQLLTYRRFSGYRLGLLLNFNVRLMKDGVRRVIR